MGGEAMSLKGSLISFAEATGKVLGINKRNLRYVYPHNERKDYGIADDKIVTKEHLSDVGINVPKTYKIYSSFYELSDLEGDLGEMGDFVIKPAMGRGGGGIMVISSSGGGRFTSVSGKEYSVEDIKKHISDIVFGVYSFDLWDRALIEERIDQHEEMEEVSPLGLADIRLILLKDRAVMAMSRVPTSLSDGKANIHQGAIGVGIDLESGRSVRAILKGEPITEHPDTGTVLVGREVPCWDEIMEMSHIVSKAVPLKYLGVDIAVSKRGPILLEVNVRPGLEIQNANHLGLRPPLERIIDEIGGCS